MSRLRVHLQSHIAAMRIGRHYFTHSPVSCWLLVTVWGIGFALPLVFWMIEKNVATLTRQWECLPQLTAYLVPSLPITQEKRVLTALRQRPEIAYVNVITPAHGLQLLEQQWGLHSLAAFSDHNPLPAVIEAHPKAGVAPSQLSRLSQWIGHQSGVASVHLEQQWLRRLAAISRFFSKASLCLMSIFLGAILLIVGYTMRLVLLSRFREVRLLQLMGATPGYIRRPFVYFGLFLGVLGSLVGLLSASVIGNWFQSQMDEVATLYFGRIHLLGLSWLDKLAVVAVVVSAGLLGSWLCLPRRTSSVLLMD